MDDEDRLGLMFATHGSITMVSVFYQLISMLFLSEGAKGQICTLISEKRYSDKGIGSFCRINKRTLRGYWTYVGIHPRRISRSATNAERNSE